jgi:hypothetical protein
MDNKREQDNKAPQTAQHPSGNTNNPFENELKVDQEIQQAQEELEKEQEFKEAQTERD